MLVVVVIKYSILREFAGGEMQIIEFYELDYLKAFMGKTNISIRAWRKFLRSKVVPR